MQGQLLPVVTVKKKTVILGWIRPYSVSLRTILFKLIATGHFPAG